MQRLVRTEADPRMQVKDAGLLGLVGEEQVQCPFLRRWLGITTCNLQCQARHRWCCDSGHGLIRQYLFTIPLAHQRGRPSAEPSDRRSLKR